MCRKEVFLAGHAQCLNQHEKKLLPQWLKNTGGKEARRGWMWCLPCSFLTFSLALQTFLLFLTSLSPFHPSFFSSGLPFFLSFPSSLCPHPQPPILNLIFAFTSVLFFISSVCSFLPSPSLSFSFKSRVPSPTLCHSTCLPVFDFLMISLFLAVSLSASLFFLFCSFCLSCLSVCLVQSQELSFSTILIINFILFLSRHTTAYTPESVFYEPTP